MLPDTVHEELKWTSAEKLIQSQEVQLHLNENHMEIIQDFTYSRVHFCISLECCYISFITNYTSLTI